MKMKEKIRIILASCLAVISIFAFGMMQYFGMEKATALVYDLARSYDKDAGGSFHGEEHLFNTEMDINGQRVHLNYSRCGETVATILSEYAARMPRDNNAQFSRIGDKGGFVAYRKENILTMVTASWDPPTGTSLITKAWSECVDKPSDLSEEELNYVQDVFMRNGITPEKLTEFVRSKDTIGEAATNLQDMLINDPQFFEIRSVLTSMRNKSARQDNPGTDFDDAPRYPDSVRRVSMEQKLPTGGHLITLEYLDFINFASADNYHYNAMTSAGWQSSTIFENASSPNSSTKKYYFTKDGKSCLVTLEALKGDFETRVSMLYLDKVF